MKLQPKEPEGTKAQGQGKRKSKANEVISAPLKRAKTQIPTSCGDTARDKFGSYGDVVGGFEPSEGCKSVISPRRILSDCLRYSTFYAPAIYAAEHLK